MARRIFVDMAPMRKSHQFRLLFVGQLITTLGNQLTVVAIPFQVYAQTHSSFQVGAISLAQLIPLVVGSLIGGSVGDAVDRRTLLLVTTGLLAFTSAGLALNAAMSHPSLVALYLISAVSAGLAGFVNPARNAAVPLLVDEEDLVAAFAFVQILFQIGTIVGPAVAGILIGGVGLHWVYAIDAVTFVITVGTIALMAPMPPVAGARRPGIGSIAEGLNYIRGRQILQGVFAIDINAMVFGMPRALFPALALTVFHGGARTLGLLYSAPGAGALIGAVTTGWVGSIRRRGWAIIGAVIIWGVAITVFGFVHLLVVALIFLAIAGWADVISAVLRNTVLQTTIPDEFRSRLSSVQMAVVQGGPRLGDMEAGGVASAFGTQFSIVSGGIACIVGAIALAGVLPRFRTHEAGQSEELHNEQIGPTAFDASDDAPPAPGTE
jgi:MFS family permease